MISNSEKKIEGARAARAYFEQQKQIECEHKAYCQCQNDHSIVARMFDHCLDELLQGHIEFAAGWYMATVRACLRSEEMDEWGRIKALHVLEGMNNSMRTLDSFEQSIQLKKSLMRPDRRSR